MDLSKISVQDLIDKGNELIAFHQGRIKDAIGNVKAEDPVSIAEMQTTISDANAQIDYLNNSQQQIRAFIASTMAG